MGKRAIEDGLRKSRFTAEEVLLMELMTELMTVMGRGVGSEVGDGGDDNMA